MQIYSKVYCRFGTYVIGLGLGYVLYETRMRSVKIHTVSDRSILDSRSCAHIEELLREKVLPCEKSGVLWKKTSEKRSDRSILERTHFGFARPIRSVIIRFLF